MQKVEGKNLTKFNIILNLIIVFDNSFMFTFIINSYQIMGLNNSGKKSRIV